MGLYFDSCRVEKASKSVMEASAIEIQSENANTNKNSVDNRFIWEYILQ
jgi:hypothetical protein